jgi:hypothetical protein
MRKLFQKPLQNAPDRNKLVIAAAKKRDNVAAKSTLWQLRRIRRINQPPKVLCKQEANSPPAQGAEHASASSSF